MNRGTLQYRPEHHSSGILIHLAIVKQGGAKPPRGAKPPQGGGEAPGGYFQKKSQIFLGIPDFKIRYRILSYTVCESFAHSLTPPSPKYCKRGFCSYFLDRFDVWSTNSHIVEQYAQDTMKAHIFLFELSTPIVGP